MVMTHVLGQNYDPRDLKICSVSGVAWSNVQSYLGYIARCPYGRANQSTRGYQNYNPLECQLLVVKSILVKLVVKCRESLWF